MAYENITLEQVVQRRIEKRIKSFSKELVKILGVEFPFIIAGNSLNKDIPNDYDLYADENYEFDFVKIKKEVPEVLSETKNALTVKIKDTTVQFCKYKKKNLKALVDSFDFAHIQIGASFKTVTSGGADSVVFKEVYISEKWKTAKVLETTFYTKPELDSSYPISSLIRIFKYKERGVFGDGSYIVAIFEILNQILKRGFNSYNDFKDQLSAVDLMVLEKNESDCAWQLYKTFEDLNLVKFPNVAKEETEITDFDD